MRAVEISDPQAWDHALLDLPRPHVLQSWAWGTFKGRHGWQPTRLLFQEEGRAVAAASVLQRRLPRLPASILYVPRGPVLDWSDAGPVGRILAELEALARRRRALFVKIDPDLSYPGDDADPMDGAGFPVVAPQIESQLVARGWRFSADQIQFRNTVLVDLRLPEDELLAAMKQKTRYNVRLATRRGVSVREGSTADLDLFYDLYAETSQRDGFLIRPPDYYRDAWGSFLEAGLAHLLLAEVETETVAGLVLFTFGPTAWYMYGASSGRHRRHMPNYLLQWEAMRRARARGCLLYDLWGAPDVFDESDPMWGVMRFKLGLGGQPVRGLGAWDYPASRAGYGFYTSIMPRVLDWMRRRGAGQAATAPSGVLG